MAIDFLLPPIQQLQGPPLKSVPITLGTPMQQPPATVQVEIDWATYGASSIQPVAIGLDLAQVQNPGRGLDVVRTVYIDNSFSFVPIYVTFIDTGYTVICPANSIMMAPVITNTGLKVLIYAQSFDDTNLPVTTLHFTNVAIAGFVVGTGVITPPIPQASIVETFNGTKPSNGTGVYSYAGVPLGSEDATRVIYALVFGRQVTGSGIDITSVTIGGNAATLVQKFGTGNVVMGIYALVVPAGASAAIVVTYTANAVSGLAAFAAYNIDTPLVAFDSKHVAGAVANPTVTLLTSGNGVAIAGVLTNAGTSFSGIGNVTTDTFSGFFRGIGYQLTDGANLTVTADGGGATALLLASSFT